MNTSIEKYCSLDVSPDGELASRLMSELDEEAKIDRHKLSDHVGSAPPDLTSAMAIWYASYIALLRKSALAEVVAQAKMLDQVVSGSGVFLEAAIDRIEDERIKKKRAAVDENALKYKDEARRCAEALANYNDARRTYQGMKARKGGRDPKVINPIIYSIYLLVIGTAEALINFESFLSLSFATPAIATGMTLLIALALAISSHFWGTALKQFAVLLDPARNDAERWSHYRMMGLGTITLAIVLGVVWWSRESYFADILLNLLAIGGTPPEKLGIIGGSMLSNLTVWIVGVLVAYMLHDSDPAFPDALRAMKQKEKAFSNLNIEVNRPLKRAFEQIDARADNDIEEVTQQDAALGNVPEHVAARKLFDQIDAQDKDVLATLGRFRGALVQRATRAATEGREVVFERKELVFPSEKDVLAPSDYAGLSLRMKYV